MMHSAPRIVAPKLGIETATMLGAVKHKMPVVNDTTKNWPSTAKMPMLDSGIAQQT